MKRFFHRALSGINFTTKILLVNIVIIMLIIGTTGYVIYKDVYTRLYQSEEILADETFDKLTEHVSNQHNLVFEQYTAMHRHGHIAEAFTDVQKYKIAPYDYSTIELTDSYFTMLMDAAPNVTDVILVGPQGIVLSKSRGQTRTVSQSYQFENYELIEKLSLAEGNFVIELDANLEYLSEKSGPVISYAGKLYDLEHLSPKQVVGYFIINFSLENIYAQFEKYTKDLISDIYYVNADNVILYSSQPDLVGTVYVEANQKGELLRSQIVDISGSRTILQLDNSKAVSYGEDVRSWFMLMLMAGIGLLIISTYLLHKTFTRKLDRIVNTMDATQNGNFHLRLAVAGTDEIGRLSASFNRMCDHIQRFIQLNYIAETQKRLAEINALQAQINPHFLYNTIDSIRQKSLSNEPENGQIVAEMLMSLAQLFRYSADFCESIVYLEDEVDYIQSYLELQKHRFGESFSYDICIPDELVYMGVPKLVLQPIVENAIVHGLKDVEVRYIRISATKVNDDLIITIEDNGCGMPQEQCDKLNEYMHSGEVDTTFHLGIGVKNVHDRVHMLFSGTSSVTLFSEQNQGTKVSLSMPALIKEEMEKCIESCL